MADGVVRCIIECLSSDSSAELTSGERDAPGSSTGPLALICNPAPAHRAGAAALPGLLDAAGLFHVKVAVTSALLRCGMEEETADVALELFAVARAAEVGRGDAPIPFQSIHSHTPLLYY